MTLAFLLFSSAVAAADYPNIGRHFWDKNAEWYQQCMRVKDAEPSAEDLLPSEPKSGIGECSATDLYYDSLDNPRAQVDDWVQVRACAFAANETGVLMMLYANGFGVPRNPRIALKYACSTFAAPAELMLRVSYFANQLGDAHVVGAERIFDFCDHITSGMGAGECMRIESVRTANRRRARLEVITDNWTDPQKNALKVAEQSLRTFADAHGVEESNYQGTGAAAFAIAAEEDLMESFLADIERLEAGNYPAYDQALSQQLESAMRDRFRALMQPEVFNGSNGQLGNTSVTKEGLQNTQAAWLQYRENWASFGQARYPSVERHAWLAMVTERRIKQLEGILEWVRPSGADQAQKPFIPAIEYSNEYRDKNPASAEAEQVLRIMWGNDWRASQSGASYLRLKENSYLVLVNDGAAIIEGLYEISVNPPRNSKLAGGSQEVLSVFTGTTGETVIVFMGVGHGRGYGFQSVSAATYESGAKLSFFQLLRLEFDMEGGGCGSDWKSSGTDAPPVAGDLISATVRDVNGDEMLDVVAEVREIDCESGKTATRSRTFLYRQGEFVEVFD